VIERRRSLLVIAILQLAVPVGFALFVFGPVLTGTPAWTPRGSLFWFPEVRAGVFVVAVIALHLAVRPYLRSREGTLRFYSDRLVVYGKADALLGLEVAWSKLESFDDSSADFVRLHSKGGDLDSILAVPTPAEDIRTRLLALLTERGLRRRG
jgi:hypothetical protein